MKSCNVCQHCYEDAVLVCPQDNGSLTRTHSENEEVAGEFRLERLLERDATGETFKARRISSDQSFVIRFFATAPADAPTIEHASVLNEMKSAAAINHPNIERVVKFGALDSGEFYAATERIGGQNLRDYLRSAGSLSESSAVIVVRQAAEALEAAHRAGIIHRAVSLANIILLDDGGNLPLIKLRNFDFGGARQRAVVASDDSNLDALRYLSPEQLADQTPNERSDIYSLGAAFYELLTGRSPFDQPTREAILHQPINEQPLEQVHFEVKALIKHLLHQALQKNPASRMSSSLNFARHLRHIEQVAAQALAFQMLKQTSNANIAAFSKNAAYTPPAAPPFNSLSDQQQMPISSVAVENTAAEKAFNSFVSPSFFEVEEIEDAAPIETASVFQPETTYVEKEFVEAIQVSPELILANQTATAEISPVPPGIRMKEKRSGIRMREKQVAAAPIAETPIFLPLPEDMDDYLPAATAIPASFDDAQRPARLSATSPQSLLIGGALVALLALAGLGAFVYDRPSSADSASREQPSPIVVAPAAPALPAAEETNFADETTFEETTFDPAAENVAALAPINETAPASIEESTIPAELKREEKIEPRQPSLTKDTPIKTDAPLKETVAFEKTSPPAAEISAGQSRLRVISKEGISRAELNESFGKWISATNARDVEQQMSHYAPKVDAYYLSRNASQTAVRSDKKRAFGRATSVDIKTDKPEIVVSSDGRTAIMRFRKKYTIKEGQKSRNGEVIQELQWVKSGSNWKIVSERDVKVVNR